MYEFDVRLSSVIETQTKDEIAKPATFAANPLAPELLDKMHRYWMAANYLTVGQIYLQANPLLREPLTPAHIKPRLLGHWGTSTGLSFIYVHLNRLIKQHDANMIYLAGPGHGGPALVANVYLEGTYSEVYPQVTQDEVGLQHLFRQFSTPRGIPSHVSVPTPGSIHEGGELGYVLSHAFGAVFDNPNLIAVAVVGDGEAETGPLEGSWKGVSFLNPIHDGAVLPILHLNGYKIAGPTVLGRTSDNDIRDLFSGHGYQVHFVEGDDPVAAHQAFAAALDVCYAMIRKIQTSARTKGFGTRPLWPMIVLRTPKGWTGPKVVDDVPIEGTFRAHQVPLAKVRENPDHLKLLDTWLRSYQPETLFDVNGKLLAELAELAPAGDRRMGANPNANGGKLLKPLDLPSVNDYALDVPQPAVQRAESTRQLGKYMRDIYSRNKSPNTFRLFCPDEVHSNRLDAVFEVEKRCYVGPIISIDDDISRDGRVMEVLSEHLCQGWLEGYLLTGRHGLFATYEAFAMVSASMTVQHAKWLSEGIKLPWRAPIASLNILLTSTTWRNDHNGFSHQGPGLIDVVLSKKGTVSRIYLPPDANCLMHVAEHCFGSRDYVNLIVIDKQPQLQYLNMTDALEHVKRGASIWSWASNERGDAPDIVLACAGDIPTMEVVAAAWLLRQYMPDLNVRVVNVVDLMVLFPPRFHPHGLNDDAFVDLFTDDKHVVFAFHGYQRAIHEIVHGRPDVDRFHVRGFNEEGTTTTPFDMVVRNEMSRYHIAADAIRYAARDVAGADALLALCATQLDRHEGYIVEHLEDMPDVRDWVWS